MKAMLTVLMFCGWLGCSSAGGGTPGSDAGGKPMDGGGGDGLSSGTLSCDVMLNGTHACTDYVWSGTAAFGAGLAQGCTMYGKIVASCSHVGSNGGCSLHHNVNGQMVDSVSWFYGLTAQQIMQVCSGSMGTFVSP